MKRGLFIAAISVPVAIFMFPVAYFGLSQVQMWLHGYGFACIPEVVRDVPSLSGKWIARVRHLDCDTLAKQYFTAVFLIHGNSLVPALSRDYVVLARDANYPDEVPMSLNWDGDNLLSIRTPSCPSEECWLVEKAPGVSVSVNEP